MAEIFPPLETSVNEFIAEQENKDRQAKTTRRKGAENISHSKSENRGNPRNSHDNSSTDLFANLSFKENQRKRLVPKLNDIPPTHIIQVYKNVQSINNYSHVSVNTAQRKLYKKRSRI